MYPTTILQTDPVLAINEKWSNETNILINDNSYATSKSGVVSAIEVGNFGFNVGSGCNFTGIEVNIKAKKKCVSCSPVITVYVVENNAGIKTYNNIGVINTLTTTEQGFTFGGANNTLGLTLSALELSNLSIALVSSDEVMVYDLRVEIETSCPEVTTPNPSSSCGLGFVQVQTKNLVNPLLTGETQMFLNNFNGIPETGYPKGRVLSMLETGGTFIYATIDEGTKNEENVKITTITNQDNSVLMTVTRGIRFTRNGTYSDPNLVKSHSAGSPVVFSNSLPFYEDLINCFSSNTDIGNTAPTNPSLGQNWYNTSNNTLYYWNGTSWVAVNGGASAGVMALNSLSGNVNLVSGTDISIVPSGNNLVINNTLSTSGFVPTSRTITGVNSVSGGGDLSANRTFELVNDLSAPGNDKFYGTTSAGVKGWRDIPLTRIEAYATNTIRLASNSVATVINFSGSYSTYKAIQVNESGTFRISYDYAASAGLETAFFISSNSVQPTFSTPNISIVRSYSTTASGTETFDIPLNKGAILNMGVKLQGTISNFQIKFDYQPSVTDGNVLV